MATNYINNTKTKTKIKIKTKFLFYLDSYFNLTKTDELHEPHIYDNVEYLGNYVNSFLQGKHLFKAWNNNEPENFTIFIGDKGDEFN